MEQTKKQTAVEFLEEKLKENLKHIVINNDHVLMGFFFLQAKEMEKQQLKENYENSNKTLTNTTASQAKEKLAVTIQAKDSNIEPPLYVKTNNLRYAKKGVQIVKEIETFELRLQQMWQGSDGSEKWEWVEIVEKYEVVE